jgi:hypothetical protein
MLRYALILAGLLIATAQGAQANTPRSQEIPIELMVMREVSAAVAKPGELFKLEAINDVRTDDRVLIARGAIAWGEVAEAVAPGAGGRGGRIAIRLLYVEANGLRVPLDGASSIEARRSNRDVAALSASLGVFALLARGHDARFKAGEIVTGFVVTENAASPPAGASIMLPAGTAIMFETLSVLSSETSVRGDRVTLLVAEDVVLDNIVIVPKGTRGFAQIIRTEPKAGFGVGGQLGLELLYIEIGARVIRLRGTASWSGRARETRGIARSVFTSAAAVAMTGRRAEIPAGTRLEGQVLRAVVLPLP